MNKQKIAAFNQTVIEIAVVVTNFIMLLMTTIFKGFGTILIAGVVLITEIHRVKQGVLMFEVIENYAFIAAIGLVWLNFIIDIIIVDIERQHGENKQTEYHFSLRLLLHNIWYFLGGSELKEKPPTSQYKLLRAVVTFTIATLGLFGSLKFALGSIQEVWYVGFWHIIARSEPSQMAQYLTATLTTLTLVFSAQLLSRHFAVLAWDITDKDKHIIKTSNIESRYINDNIVIAPSKAIHGGLELGKMATTLPNGERAVIYRKDNEYHLKIKGEDGNVVHQTFDNELDLTTELRKISDLRKWSNIA